MKLGLVKLGLVRRSGEGVHGDFKRMIGRAYSTTLVGIDSLLVSVEAQITGALKRFTMVGLPDGVVRESRERVRCAIEQSNLSFPTGDLVISLSPATLPKFGSGFDLAIAVSILVAAGVIPVERVSNLIFLGELALDGSIRAAKGALSAACLASNLQNMKVVVSKQSAHEARLVDGVDVFAVSSLEQLVGCLSGARDITDLLLQSETSSSNREESAPALAGLGFGDVVGQFGAKRALEISAAGGHSTLMVGSPGSGKSMLAARIVSLLPPLSLLEQIEVTKIHAASAIGSSDSAGLESRGSGGGGLSGGLNGGLIQYSPFRAPHYSLSTAGLVGGGPIPAPGEISLAHRGVLFLDELTEMRRETLESLRQPLETKSITVSRAKLRVTFPANFIFLAAVNPCPCGKRGLEGGGCLCSPGAVARYFGRISGPILDRIDLQVWVPPVPITDFAKPSAEDPTAGMRERVLKAREIQLQRGKLNAGLSAAEVKRYCQLSSECSQLVEKASQRFKLSARGYSRILRTSRTIADLEGSLEILPNHIAEVLQYRFE